MTRETFEQRLAPLTARQESATTALVEEYGKDLADVYSAALRFTQSGSASAGGALSVLAQLAETAVKPIAAAIPAQQPVPSTPLLFDLANGIAVTESVVAGRLKAALTDTRAIPQPPEARFIEEVGPPHRVCDEAYTGLRRILHAESRLQCAMETRHFLMLPDEDKNQEIESCMRTGSFTKFLDDVDVD
jgi:hypothetical protein